MRSPLAAIRARRIHTMQPGHPGAAPIDDGLLVWRDDTGRIEAVGPYRSLAGDYDLAPGRLCDLGEVELAPGVVNCHNHLDLSHMRGRTRPGLGFAAWLTSMLAQPMDALDRASLDSAVAELAASGTTHVGDITSRNPAMVDLALEHTGISVSLLFELFSHQPPPDPTPDNPDGLPPLPEHAAVHARAHGLPAPIVAGHALYSTHPETLRRAKARTLRHGQPYSLHLAETAEEVDMLATGSGPLFGLFRDKNVLPEGYRPPGVSPVRYAKDLGLLDRRTLAVHCVQLDDADVALLAESRASVCLCPRSNDFIGVGFPRLDALRKAGVPLCIGTDSLASNTDLDPWSEAMFLLEKSRLHISVHEVLAWLTINGARALGMDRECGMLAPGMRAAAAVIPGPLLEAAG